MAFVPLTELTADVEKSRTKRVRCSRCGCTYTYVLQRQASSSRTYGGWYYNESVAKEVTDNATRKVHDRLYHGVDPVQCPDCGYYEPGAVREIRRRHGVWMFWAAGVSAFLAWPIALIAYRRLTDWQVESKVVPTMLLILAALLTLAAVGLVIGKFVAARRLDPNRGYPATRPAPYPGAPKVTRTEPDQDPIWRIALDGEERGPLSMHQIRQMISAGQLDSTVLVWKEGMPDWTRLNELQQ